jgi:hypothetical protein
MINDQEFLHGAAFLKLINAGERITIAHLAEIHPSIYLISSDRNQSAVLFCRKNRNLAIGLDMVLPPVNG